MSVPTLLVSRHPGAQAWLRAEAERRGWPVAGIVEHLPGPSPAGGIGRVAGVLPIGLAFDLAAAGLEVWWLDLRPTVAERGRELSAERLVRLGARLRRFHVQEGEVNQWPGR
ncbi:MAG: CRISPR-associated protein Csx16 [Sphingomonadaceae bacterium]